MSLLIIANVMFSCSDNLICFSLYNYQHTLDGNNIYHLRLGTSLYPFLQHI